MRAPWQPPNFVAFRYPVFRRVWAAGLVSQLGDWVQIVGRSFLAFQLISSGPGAADDGANVRLPGAGQATRSGR